MDIMLPEYGDRQGGAYVSGIGAQPPQQRPPQPRSRSPTRRGSDRVLSFGRHVGETFEDVLRNDSQYCRWAAHVENPGLIAMREFQQWCRSQMGLRNEAASSSEHGSAVPAHGRSWGAAGGMEGFEGIATRHFDMALHGLGVLRMPGGPPGLAALEESPLDDSDDEDSEMRAEMRAILEDSESEDEPPAQSGVRQMQTINILASLPTVTHSPALFSGDPHPEACPICLEDFAPSNDLPHHQIVLTPCLHAFHGHCLKGWLARNFHCPSCRWDLRDTGERAATVQLPRALVAAPADIIGTTIEIDD